MLPLGLLGAAALAQDAGTNSQAEHKFELAKQYYGDCANVDEQQFQSILPQLKAFTDMEVMADTMADPAKFATLMTVVNDPHTIHVMSKCATEPVMWDTWMRGMTDFNKMTRVMMRFMNPNMYFSWMMAPMNPAMYQPFMQMGNPAYYNKWMTAMMNPVYYEPMTSLMNPNWYVPRINWMMNPQSMQPMFNMMGMGGMVPMPGSATAPGTEAPGTSTPAETAQTQPE
ncbi:MAG: hypothetical protein ACR2QW_06695 [bacterium]